MNANALRKLVLGLIAGVTVSVGWVEPLFNGPTDEELVAPYAGLAPKPSLEPVAKAVVPPSSLQMRLLVAPMKLSHKEFQCLALNIFQEAGVEDDDGKLGVAQVTLNRVEHSRWNNSFCGVVYEKKQFSWTNSLTKRKETPTGPLWEASKRAARALERGERIPELMDSVFYHTDYIAKPSWASDKYAVAQIGQHIFYNNDLKK